MEEGTVLVGATKLIILPLWVGGKPKEGRKSIGIVSNFAPPGRATTPDLIAFTVEVGIAHD